MTETTTPVPSPRVRWGAIAWGVILTSTAIGTLLVVGSPGRRAAFSNWLAEVTPATVALLATLFVGGLLLLLGLLAVIRRVQRNAGRSQET